MVCADKKLQPDLAGKDSACYPAFSQPERVAGVMADDAVLEILKGIQSSIAALDEKFTTQYTILAQDVRMIRGGIRDMIKTRVTAGEVDALHEDMTRMQLGLADLATRVEVLEGHRHHE